MVSRRVQDLLLVALAIVAALTTYLAFANVRNAGGGETPGTTASAQGTSPTTDETATETEGEADVDTETATATDDTEADPLAVARGALEPGGSPTVLVLGDSTSNERTEWVHLWAQQLAETRPVSISHWNEASASTYNEADVLSEEGDGGEVTIWSGSVAGATPESTVELMPAIAPQRPDFVILNFGHNMTADAAADQMSTLYAAVRDMYPGVPAIVTLQNPQLDDANADVREAIQAWAEENNVGVIDIASQFDVAAWPLLVDEVHPSAEGQQIWADTVSDALGG